MGYMTRVLVVDDHALMRDMLRERLNQEPDLEVIGAASNAEEAMLFVEDLAPDLVVLDIDMPGLSAFEAARQIRHLLPDTRVLFLSAYVQDGYISQVLQVRACGYATKGNSPESLIACIRKVAQGGTCFSGEIERRLEIGVDGVRLANALRTRAETLTPREREVLIHLARGASKKVIAKTLGVSVKTVEQHCIHVMQKLDIHDRVELARFAVREGMVEP